MITWKNRSRGITQGILFVPINTDRKQNVYNQLGRLFSKSDYFKPIKIMLFVEFLRLFLGRHDER